MLDRKPIAWYNICKREVVKMNYILRLYDTELLRFSANENSNDPQLSIQWISEENRHLLPLDFDGTSEGLYSWLRHRTIPKNRAYVNTLLARCNLSVNRPMKIIDVCKGLSLNDAYWVTREDFVGTFEKYNLYDNRFSQVLALLAFIGYGSRNLRTSMFSSPEMTTNGMLPKCWRRISGKISLYKGGTAGASNTGFEPYSEFYAAQIAQAMGINAISYKLSKWKGMLCSTCELFTSKEIVFLPVGRVAHKGGIAAIEAYYAQLGQEYLDALYDMYLFDAVICNTDRHFGNFGFLVDSKTNRIIAPAPLFDHGNALFNLAGQSDLMSQQSLEAYAKAQLPCVYDDFFEMAKKHMTPRHREMLRHLLTFRFKKHSRFNLPKERLKLVEAEVQRCARLLLEE